MKAFTFLFDLVFFLIFCKLLEKYQRTVMKCNVIYVMQEIVLLSGD